MKNLNPLTMSTKKWGIIGLGKISNKFAQALAIVEGAEIYAVASRTLTKAQDFAKAHQAKVAYGSYDALFQDENIDVVYIGTPHGFVALGSVKWS